MCTRDEGATPIRVAVCLMLLASGSACRRRNAGHSADEGTQSPVVAPTLRLPDVAIDSLPPLTSIPGDLQSAARIARGIVCGYAEVGGRYYPLDCVRAMATPLRWASRAVLMRTLVSDTSDDPDVVDPRRAGTLGPIRSQGQVGSCTAFSLAATIDHELRRDGVSGAPVSTMLLWSRYHYPSMTRAASANSDHLLAPEASWPYDESLACGWSTDPECDCRGGCGRAVDEAQQRSAEGSATAQLVDVESLDASVSALRHALARGRSVWFSMVITRSFDDVRVDNPVVRHFDGRNSRAGHAMSLVGYSTQQDGTWFLIQNSWGSDWGDHGFAWIHERTLLNNLSGRGAYVLHVRPASAPPPSEPQPEPPTLPEPPTQPEPPSQPVPPQPEPPVQPAPVPPVQPAADDPAAIIPTILGGLAPQAREVDRIVSGILPGLPGAPGACPAGQVPDALTGACSNQCADGSPPLFGQCTQIGRCPASNVDVGGRCFRAAPQRARTRDVPSGVTYQCGAGGCVYWISPGAHACRRAGGCVVSCATPRSVLIESQRGVGCSF